ncbi:MAG: pirin family protein, partial [Saprospiraceae bacterium]
PHDNMEIISIPLEGDLQHKDSMGTVATIRHGDIQAMSAGTGVRHSEYNASKENPVKFLQIWILPNATNVKPRYDQITLDLKDRHNQLQQILSPHAGGPGVWIHQQAWFHLGNFDKDFQVEYELKRQGNGVYAFVLNGDFKIGDQLLHHRDGYGIWDIEKLDITALSSSSEILLMEVPMEV